MSKSIVTIVGCGWMGAALGLGVKAALKDAEVVGHDKDVGAQRRAEQLKAIDKGNWNLPGSCENARLIFLAIPHGEIEPTLRAIGPYVALDTVIVAVGSAMQPVLAGAAKHLPASVGYIACDIVLDPNNVPANMPIEQITAAVFKGAAWVITPRPGTAPDPLAAVSSLAMSLDAHPIFMDAVEHDGLRLAVDALPAVVGAAVVNSVTGDDAWRERVWLAGHAFGAATAGVESSDAGLVARTMVDQRVASVHWLNQVMLSLMDIRDAVDKGDVDRVRSAVEHAREQRDAWINTWHKGRPTGEQAKEMPKQSFSGLFLGERLADRLKSGRR